LPGARKHAASIADPSSIPVAVPSAETIRYEAGITVLKVIGDAGNGGGFRMHPATRTSRVTDRQIRCEKKFASLKK
jgi:hypothetical protein